MSQEELEKRIQILEDIEEIKQLQIRYVNCFTTTRWDDLTDCFSENGIVDIESGFVRGKKGIKKHYKEKVAMNHIGQEGNFVVHPVITVDGDKAKGSWLLYIQFAQPRKLKSRPQNFATDDAPDWWQGYYEMEYVKEDGRWKIGLLKIRPRLWSPMPGRSSN
jgi:hypothetical protein